MEMKLRVRYSVLCVLLFLLSTAAAEPATAQDSANVVAPSFILAIDDVFEPPATTGGFYDPALLPWYKAGFATMGVLLIFFIAWYLAYPWALRRGHVWPVSLFGICTATAWGLSWGLVLLLYWNEMNVPPHDPWWREWGLRLVCIAMLALFSGLSWAFWRTAPKTLG